MGGGSQLLTAHRDAALPEGPADETLITRLRAGEDRAFELLYARYRRRIASYVQGMVGDRGRAEDITQEVFISALRRMRDTDRPIAFRPWIYEIAKNACIDQFRRAKRADEVSFDAEEGLGAADYGRLAEPGPTPEVAVDQKEQLDNLRGAFGGLSESHHRILVLRELEGLSYREIGDRMGLTRPAVESTLFRARRRLTEEYDELASGERCQRIQSVMAMAAEGILGTRDQRKLARHLSHCQPCRREARLLGVSPAPRARRPVRQKIAAFVPLPAFIKRRLGGKDLSNEGGAVSNLTASHGGTLVTQWSATLGTNLEPIAAGWTKAAAAAATLALASVGAGMATREAGPQASAASPAPARAPDHRDARVRWAERPAPTAFRARPDAATPRSHSTPSAAAPETVRPTRPTVGSDKGRGTTAKPDQRLPIEGAPAPPSGVDDLADDVDGSSRGSGLPTAQVIGTVANPGSIVPSSGSPSPPSAESTADSAAGTAQATLRDITAAATGG
jgi:RNA polymerase sigma factor (sigma-70 family)